MGFLQFRWKNGKFLDQKPHKCTSLVDIRGGAGNSHFPTFGNKGKWGKVGEEWGEMAIFLCYPREDGTLSPHKSKNYNFVPPSPPHPLDCTHIELAGPTGLPTFL